MARSHAADVALSAFCLLACLLGLASAGNHGTEFSPTIIMTNLYEMGAPCISAVDRAATFNAKSVEFVPTVHYNGGETQINSYCYRNQTGGCDAITAANIKQYASLLETCMAHAVSKGLNIAALPHLDNQVGYTWRNVLQFSPLSKYGGYSYRDVVLDPVTTAIAESINKNTEVSLVLQGETGKSISQYAAQWLGLVSYVKQRIAAGGKATASKILVGVSLNYNKVYGWIDFDTITPAQISADFAANFNAQKSKYPLDLPNMKKLYDTIDVMGVSAYPPLPVDFTQADLEVTLKYHAQELSYAGIDIKALIAKGKRLEISEWGVGGGTQDGNNIAASVSDVAGYPFFGLWYPFSQAKNPWKISSYNAYREKLYTATAQWLSSYGGPTYRVDSLRVWCAGSWDALGINYQTANSQGTWADAGVQATVRSHNAAVNKA